MEIACLNTVHNGHGNSQNEIAYTTVVEIACLNTVHDGRGNRHCLVMIIQSKEKESIHIYIFNYSMISYDTD